MSTEHLKYLDSVAASIVATLKTKEAMYQGSWKKRGGTGAFFVSARKWDALESMLHKRGDYDIIWGAVEQGEGDGTIIEQIRDLVGYLLLIECEVTRLVAERKEKGEYVGLGAGAVPMPKALGEQWEGKRIKRAFTHKAMNRLIQGGAASGFCLSVL